MDNILNRSQKTILHLIYASFVFSLAYILGLGMSLKADVMLQILMVFLGSALVKFFLLNPLVLYILLVAGFMAIILVHRFISPILFPLMERIYYLFQNIIQNLQGKENITSDNLLLFWGLLIVLISFFTAFILFKNKSIYLLLPAYIGPFLYYWYSFFDEALWMLSIFLLAFFILMGLDKYSREKTQTSNLKGYNFEKLYTPWIQTVTIYSILILSLALVLPKSNNNIQWPMLQQKVYKTFPVVEKLRSNEGYGRRAGKASLFDFSITGYQEESSRLGGPVKLNPKKIMTVRTNSNSNYLRGNAKQVYTGSSWRTINEPSKNYPFKRDFSGLSKEERNLYYDQTYVTITNHAFASTTLFSPYKAAEVIFDDGNALSINRDDSLTFSKGIYDGESYTIRVQKPLPYGTLTSLGIDKKKSDIDDLELYLQIPEDKITERTKALTKEIVKGKNNDFEKAMAIENHLRSNYKYNLNVNQVPENKEFIDYFLFEEGEGYCTYYATAMAIMLRLEGIPSRYIEGYLAQDLIEPGIYEVSHSNAHAWVEAFIEPVGWMTFEPTSIYPIELRLESLRQDVPNDSNNLNEAAEYVNHPENSINDQLIHSDEDILGNRVPKDKINHEDTPSNLPKNIVAIIIGALLLIIPIRFIIGFFQHRYKEARAKKLDSNKRIIYLYKQILRLMEFLGHPQQHGETHYEYAERVAYKFYSYGEIKLKEVTEIFVKSKYGNFSIQDEERLILEKYREDLEKRLQNYWGLRTFYYRKYVKAGYIKD